ncbi:MAG: DUF983 domain-containing protein [Paracoccus sp. (in: a-proteobacteria)]|nr:DUF983 domain-containing protein [Paracoccus sp. (in: a-proteobacteria)]
MESTRDMKLAIRRGGMNRCPNCGQGRLFKGYLQVVGQCDQCGEPLGDYRVADGPAFFTITIVMLLLIPMIWITSVAFQLSPVTMLIGLGAVTTALTLILLRYIKGVYVGFTWAKNELDPGA